MIGGNNNKPVDQEAAMRKDRKRKAIQLFNRGIECANAGKHDDAIKQYLQVSFFSLVVVF